LQILSNKENKFLGVSLLGIVAIYIIANLFDQEQYTFFDDWVVTDLLFIIVPVIVIVLGIILSAIYKGSGSHGKAWILFTISVILWFAGEMVYGYDTESSYVFIIDENEIFASDVFYILAYPIFFAFTILYLKPRKNVISKNMILTGVLVSIMFVIPTLYLTFDNEELDQQTVFYAIYPILDAVILIPSIIAVILFFRGEVNFLWTLILFGIISDVIADTLFLFLALEESYYSGHPIDILFIFAYLLFAFGVYSHIKLYRNPSK